MNFKPQAALLDSAQYLLIAALAIVTTIMALPAYAANASARATTLRLASAVIDDSATVVLDGTPAMNWRSIAPKNRDNAIVGRTRVNVRLATAPWLGKSGKIYMVLPMESSGSMKIAWRSHGVLLDGQLTPGGRTLVYTGVIRAPRMEDVLEVQIEADGTRLSHPQQLRFHFEIDVE